MDTDPTTSDLWIVLAATTIVQALATMNVLLPPAVAPELADALGVPAAFIGLQVSVVYGGAMVTAAFSGYLVRRLGAIQTSQLAMLFSALGIALAATASLPALVTGAVLVGFGYGLTNPAASHLLMSVSQPSNRNLIFSLKQTGVPLGGIAAGLVAPPVTVAASWQWAFAVGAMTSVAFIAGLQVMRRKWDADRDPAAPFHANPLKDLSIVWTNKGLRWLASSAFFFSAIQLSLMAFVVTMLVADLGYDLIEAGLVLAAIQVAGTCGRVLWGWLADHVGDGLAVLMLLAGISIVGSAATATLSPQSGTALIYLLLAGFGLVSVGWNGVFLAEIARRVARERVGTVVGGALIFTFAGILVGPAVFTGLYGVIGSYTKTFGVFALVPAAGLVMVYLARRAGPD